METGERLLLDTNVIIEAHRVNCWKLLLDQFILESTEECCREAAGGYTRRGGYVAVDVAVLRKDIRIHKPTPDMMTKATATALNFQSIDPGEREVLAIAFADAALRRVGTADRIAIQVASQLGLLERVVSLEEILQATGDSRALLKHHTKKWLSDIKLQLLLDGLS